MIHDQIEMQQTLGKYFKFSHQVLSRCHLLVKQNKVSPSFLKGHLGIPFTLSGVVSDNNTTYSCKIQQKDVQQSIQVQCNCQKLIEGSICEHVLSLFYTFYQQQVLQGSLLQHQQNLTDDGCKSPRFGIQLKNPSDLITKQRLTNFLEATYTLLDDQKIQINKPTVLPPEASLEINLMPGLDQLGKPIFQNQRALYYLESQLHLSHQILSNINIFGNQFIFDWQTGATYQLPSKWTAFYQKYLSCNLLLTLDEHLSIITSTSPTTEFKIENQFHSLDQAIRPKLCLNVSEGRISNCYFLTLGAKNQEQSIGTPLLLSLFAEKNNPFSQTDNLLDTSKLAQTFFKFKFSDDLSDQNVYSNEQLQKEKDRFNATWLDDSDAEILPLLHQHKDKIRIEQWLNCWTHSKNIFTFDTNERKLYRWDCQELVFLLAKLYQWWGTTLFKKSEWVSTRSELVFEIGHHALFKSIGDAYRDLNWLAIDLFWQQKPLYRWKTTSNIHRINHDLDWFNLRIDLNPDDLKILQQIQSNQTVQWLDGKMILLSDEQKIFTQLLKKYLPSQIKEEGNHQVSIKILRARIFELFYLKNLGFGNLLTAEEEALCQSLLNFKSIPRYPLPERYEGVLRHYQQDGYCWLRFLYEHQLGGCLADDMGLGKTVQSIALIQSLKSRLKKVLIVCPVSILWNWQQELAKFSDLDVKLYYGDQRSFSDSDQIILTSYGLLKRDFESVLSKHTFDLLILDEVQQLKNFNSLGSQIAKQLQAKVRFVLTGTPVENEITEFYNILELCVPGLWGDHKWQRRGFDEAKSVAKAMSKPFVLRRTKAQVLKELPEKTEQLMYLSFTPDEENNYATSLAQIQQSMIEQNNKQVVGQVLKNLLLLRQLCLWQNIQHAEFSTKISFLMETAEQLLQEKHSIIIFSQFTSYLDLIQKNISSLTKNISRIDGSQSLKSRQEHVNKFQDGTNPIFLISLRAGGFGLNLTRASYLFLMDPWWNPAVENQAIDRAHRIGQNKHLTVYRPIIRNTVEEKVLLLQQEKKKLFDELVNAEDGDHFSGKLTMDDFKFLLS